MFGKVTYTVVTLNAVHQSLFGSRGVARIADDGKFHCKTCSTPTYYRHTLALVGSQAGDEGPCAAATTTIVSQRIADHMCLETRKLRTDCISIEKVPFCYPNDYPDVWKHY